jgi:hypothetical protein
MISKGLSTRWMMSTDHLRSPALAHLSAHHRRDPNVANRSAQQAASLSRADRRRDVKRPDTPAAEIRARSICPTLANDVEFFFRTSAGHRVTAGSGASTSESPHRDLLLDLDRPRSRSRASTLGHFRFAVYVAVFLRPGGPRRRSVATRQPTGLVGDFLAGRVNATLVSFGDGAPEPAVSLRVADAVADVPSPPDLHCAPRASRSSVRSSSNSRPISAEGEPPESRLFSARLQGVLVPDSM